VIERALKMMAPVLALLACMPSPASAAPPLVLEKTIPLTGVAGRIDHLAIDREHGRLFVAALGNGTVEAIDVGAGRAVGRITGLAEPQGLAVAPSRSELVVASGGDGTVRFYSSNDLSLRGSIRLGDDADNVRLDPGTGRVIVGYGAGALAVIEPATRSIVRQTPLPAHPESFQLDGQRAYVNLPNAGHVGVVDLAVGKVIATWANRGRRFNFPMAIDRASGDVAVVYRLPARLVTFDPMTGAERQALATCGDADDLFFDAKRSRAYVTCGSGDVDVFERRGRALEHVARVATSAGARTGLFSPELDRLFVAARAQGGRPAAILVFRPQ
jgi:DNA-binding beta-propeller fold protein YncE